VVADRWFPSSKICSCCGVVKDTLDLNERIFRCDDCGFECDLNAARNLEKYAESFAALKAATAAQAASETALGEAATRHQGEWVLESSFRTIVRRKLRGREAPPSVAQSGAMAVRGPLHC
jgi:Putative transposase DNA-binding domain